MWLTLGLKLLGIGKFLRDFLLQNWKWVVPILIVIGSYFYIKHLISNAYDDGVHAEKTRWEQKIKDQDEANRRTEEALKGAVNNFGTKVAEEAAKRAAAEQTVTDRVNTIIREKPVYTDCKADQEIIDLRNQIRNMGPGK